MTDGFAMLEQQHRDIERKFQAYQQDDDSVVRELCEELTHHARLEEAALSPALRRYADGGDDLADQAESEQSAVATMIAELYDSATPERVPELVAALRSAVAAHIDAVESEIVPALRASRLDPEQLGRDLAAADHAPPDEAS